MLFWHSFRTCGWRGAWPAPALSPPPAEPVSPSPTLRNRGRSHLYLSDPDPGPVDPQESRTDPYKQKTQKLKVLSRWLEASSGVEMSAIFFRQKKTYQQYHRTG
jgi:hypothetical protein